MEAVVQNLLNNAPALIVFIGMFSLVWKLISANHDITESIIAKTPALPPAPMPVPVPAPVSRPPISPPPVVPATPSDAITPGFVAFVKKEEGFSAKAYWDYKQWSIGYGTRATSSTEVITEAEATTRLIAEIHKADKLVTDKYPNLPVGVHQALTDLTYNAGSGWENQTLGQRVAEQKWDTVKADILQYNHAGGAVNAGLTKRREAEVSWFDNPI